MSVSTGILGCCCFECPGWVPLPLLQFTCLRFFLSFLDGVPITNILCRHASSLEASVYHFRADCGLVVAERAVPMHTQTHLASHLQSHWMQSDKERTNSRACLRSYTLSWPFTSYFKAGRCFLAWAISPCSTGCAHKAAKHGPDPLLQDMASYLLFHTSSWAAGQMMFLWPGNPWLYSCTRLAQHFENIGLFGWKAPHSTNIPIIC